MGAAPAPGIALMGLWKKVGRLFAGGAVDTVTLEDVQRLLVEADFGVAATNETVAKLSRADTVDQASLERIIGEELGPAATPLARAAEPPTVILIFGVNGTGKTTSVAKLAKLLQREGRSVLLAAADTFRAGATEQLKVWADRLSAPFVGASQRGDPAAVAFDAMFPDWNPADDRSVNLSMQSALDDSTKEFWITKAAHLRKEFDRHIRVRVSEAQPNHFSVFALEPVMNF